MLEIESPAPVSARAVELPWMLWVVIVMLGLEGLGNLLNIPGDARNVFWLGSKVLMVLGFVRGWRWVFVASLILMALHVVGFANSAPVVAALNGLLFGLIAGSWGHFWHDKPKPKPVLHDLE